ncbi:nuclear transport factor 2 family protein [Dyella acidiphila]|uniref:Nuclear transport factor 2 family protein n=1 Tax=Dyella acidiphila TaxID=2775866 RepID=A0ABR9G4Z6_9GAMM|nr:nuclear transport factor 2 family protein [Dyella acidiphila]MBE1159088.1 nuclear transport factor 2 family protein [Dyella acidiphila]
MTVTNYRRSMLLMGVLVAALLAVAVHYPRTIDADAGDAANADETAHSEAGVLALEQHWSIAEMAGDTGWLEQMLAPGFRSVSNDGSVHDKQAIVAGAAKRKGTSLAQAQRQFADYQQQHPYGSAVLIQGDTAVVSFYDPALGPQKGVKSADIFVYADGGWHAFYSQHTGLNK